MGRYYSGDIEGQFVFGIQNSYAADRFGVEGVNPSVLYYYFDEGDIPFVEEGLQVIRENIGVMVFNEIYEKYLDEALSDEELLKLTEGKKEDLKYYWAELADYYLGSQILDCLNKQGYCEFEAEY